MSIFSTSSIHIGKMKLFFKVLRRNYCDMALYSKQRILFRPYIYHINFSYLYSIDYSRFGLEEFTSYMCRKHTLSLGLTYNSKQFRPKESFVSCYPTLTSFCTKKYPTLQFFPPSNSKSTSFFYQKNIFFC